MAYTKLPYTNPSRAGRIYALAANALSTNGALSDCCCRRGAEHRGCAEHGRSAGAAVYADALDARDRRRTARARIAFDYKPGECRV